MLYPLLFLLSISAQQLNQQYLHHCLDPICQKFEITPAANVANLQKRQVVNNQTLTAQSDNGMLQFSIDCFLNQQTCQWIAESFRRSGNAFTSILNLQTPIKVHALFHDFCQEDTSSTVPQSKCHSVLGFGRPASYWTLTGNDPIYNEVLFPQALAKQILPPEQQLQSGQVNDIEMEFNSLSINNLYFPASNQPIQDYQYDFQYLVTHEIVHGLGMVSSYDLNANQLVQPTFSTSSSLMNIYDYYLAFDNQNSFQYFRDLSPQQVTQAATTTLGSVFLFPQQKPDNLALRNTFTMSQLDYLYVDSRNPFSQGSSLVHVDQQKYTNSEEFLMRPTAPRGQTLQQLMNQNGGPVAPFGRGLVRVLGTLGFPLQPGMDLIISENYKSNADSLKVGWNFSLLFLFYFFFQ